MLIKVRKTITLIKRRGLIEKFYDAFDTLLTLEVSLISNYVEVASGVKMSTRRIPTLCSLLNKFCVFLIKQYISKQMNSNK